MVMLDENEGYNPELSTVLKATDKFNSNYYYFALPLSPQGINELYEW